MFLRNFNDHLFFIPLTISFLYNYFYFVTRDLHDRFCHLLLWSRDAIWKNIQS